MKTSTTCYAKPSQSSCYTIESSSLRFRYVLTLGGTGRASIFSRGCVGGDAWAVGGKSNAWRVTSLTDLLQLFRILQEEEDPVPDFRVSLLVMLQ